MLEYKDYVRYNSEAPALTKTMYCPQEVQISRVTHYKRNEVLLNYYQGTFVLNNNVTR